MDNIQNESLIWTDGLKSYNELITQKHYGHKVVKAKNDYDKVNHLSNVNTFHQRSSIKIYPSLRSIISNAKRMYRYGSY